MKQPALLVAAACVLLMPSTAAAARTCVARSAEQARVQQLRESIVELRAETWRYQDARQARRSQTFHRERHADVPTLWRLHSYWWRLKVRARRAYKHHQAALARAARHAAEQRRAAAADVSAWMCIHSFEGSWTDPNPPYYGGLQMDSTFQSQYGPEFVRQWGTADHWPVWAQLTAARRARDGYAGFHARGYWPWPNTARMCGLL
jgi:hypothetical protein